MSNFGDGRGGYNQDQQSFAYNDGTTQVSYSSQQYSWSSSQQRTPTQTPVPIPLQQLRLQTMPQMLPVPDINQIHQQQMDLHRAHMQSAMKMQQNAMNNMRQPFQFQQSPLMPAPQQPQMQYAPSPPPQPQIQYAPSPPPQLALPPGQPLQIEAAAEEARRDSQAAERDRQMLDVAQGIKDHMQRNDQQSRKREEARARKEAAQEAKDEQARKEQQERFNKLENQLAELSQSQAAMAQPASPAFDMDALQKIIRDSQKDNTSKDDLKQFINDAVSTQLSGVARSSDLELAASRMQRSIHKVAGASDAQVQEIVKKELTDAINRVARHMPAQQEKIDGPHQQQSRPGPPSSQRIETQFTVEELPDEDEEAKRTHKSSSHRKSKALPAPDLANGIAPSQASQSQREATVLAVSSTEQQVAGTLTTDALERLQPPAAVSESSQNRHSKIRASVVPTDENAMVRVKHSDYRPSRSSKMSTVSVQPSPDNALKKSGIEETAQVDIQPSRSSKMSTMSVQPSASNALVRPKADNAQQSELKPSSSFKKSTMSVQRSAHNAVMRPGGSDVGHAQEQDKVPNKSSKMSTMSVQPSEHNALVRHGSDEAPKHHSKHSRSLKKSAMSAQPSASNAMVWSGAGTTQQYASSAEAMAAAQAQRGQPSEYGGHQGLGELPDDFPDNASQVTAWQRGQATKQPVTKGSTVRSIRPRNDRRGEAHAPSPLRQLEAVQEEDEDSVALVKQTKDVSKKSGR